MENHHKKAILSQHLEAKWMTVRHSVPVFATTFPSMKNPQNPQKIHQNPHLRTCPERVPSLSCLASLSWRSRSKQRKAKTPEVTEASVWWEASSDTWAGWLIGILISWLMKWSLYHWAGFHPLYNLTNLGSFHCSHQALANVPRWYDKRHWHWAHGLYAC